MEREMKDMHWAFKYSWKCPVVNKEALKSPNSMENKTTIIMRVYEKMRAMHATVSM